jgi:predicted  nucleic acid-binding Zn-ribbon protein
MNEQLERLVRIEEQVKNVKESVEAILDLQKQQNGSVRSLETKVAVLESRLDSALTTTPPSVTKLTTYSTGIASTIIAIVIAMIEFFKQ